MFKQVKTHKKFVASSGTEYVPVATLTDKHGGIVNIIIDDGCFVCYLYNEETGFVPTHYLFAELHKVLSSLPLIEEVDCEI